MDKQISVTETLRLLRKKTGMILGFCLTGMVVAFMVTFYLVTPQYRSTTQMLVNRTQTNEFIQESDIDTNLQLINTYKDIIQSPVILNEVQSSLNMNVGNEDLMDQIEISSKETSQVFAIHVTDESPTQAAKIANTIAGTFQSKIVDIMNVENVTVISEAIPYTEPVSPNLILNLAVGFLLGMLLSLGKIFIGEQMDNTVKTEQFITEELKWSNLGQINQLSAEELAAKKLEDDLDSAAQRTGVKSRV